MSSYQTVRCGIKEMMKEFKEFALGLQLPAWGKTSLTSNICRRPYDGGRRVTLVSGRKSKICQGTYKCDGHQVESASISLNPKVLCCNFNPLMLFFFREGMPWQTYQHQA